MIAPSSSEPQDVRRARFRGWGALSGNWSERASPSSAAPRTRLTGSQGDRPLGALHVTGGDSSQFLIGDRSISSYGWMHGLPAATHIRRASTSATIEYRHALASSPSSAPGCKQIDWGVDP
jgi:hypothetical protein